MHILLTDRLACPRCGPEFGLILLAHHVRDRRVLEGDLGCPNCRETYPVREGFADLRPPPRPPLPPPADEGDADEDGAGKLARGKGVAGEPSGGEDSAADSGRGDEVLRLGALLGVTEGPGMILLKGPVARHGKALADLIEHVEVVVMAPDLGGAREEEGVSRLVGRGRIPFFSDSFRGVALSGKTEIADVEEACRVLAPLSRLVIMGGGPETAARVRSLGLSVLLEQDHILAARKEGAAAPSPLIPLRGPRGPSTLP
jgi:uncharacterized protein YbaR (Trm112 family)